jgi:hypothetical protein
MGSSFTYPDGSSLISSALTIKEIGAALQPLVCGMLGIAEPESSPAVRIEYGPQGQPYNDIDEDVCYFRCMPTEDPYTRIRDRFNWGPNGWGEDLFGREAYGGSLDGNPALTEQWTYTNSWKIHFCFIGPNSYDRARAVRSAFYQDYFTDALALSQLFPVSDFPMPVRAPELFDGQWFERVDLDVEMYEFVTETINRQTVISVEVVLLDAEGEIADLVPSAPGWGAGPFGPQPFGT